MQQEIFCYIKGKEHVHFLSIDGSFEAHDILAEFIIQISKLTEKPARDIMHTVNGKLQVLIQEETMV